MATSALTVVHALPGRVRLRVPRYAAVERVVAAVSAVDGVTACTWSPQTRGLLVRYDRDATDLATIVEHVAEETGLDTPLIDDAAPTAATNGAAPPLTLAVPSLFAQANRRVARATRGTLDLASGIPLLLVAWAALELLRGRAAPLAWSSALWYAHGLFRDYNVPPSPS